MKRMTVVVCIALSLLAVSGPAVAAASLSSSAGLTLQQLDAEDLDAIQQETGYRVGVLVMQVAAGSAAERAGLRVGDLILTCGDGGVDSPAALDAQLMKATGMAQILVLRGDAAGGYGPAQIQLDVSAAQPALAQPRPAAAALAPPAGGDGQAKLAALDAALAAGIIGQDEYARKKAEIVAQMTPPAAPDPELQRKLQALQSARNAGILTEAEYVQKKAELEAQAGPQPREIDPATRQKLAALQTAHDAGILSDAEFEAKKAELLGGAPAPAAGPAPAADPGKGATYRHPIGFAMWYPQGWKVQELEGLLQLVPNDAAVKDGQAVELYFVTGESVAEDGITQPDDPRVTAYMNQQVVTFAPQLQPKGVTGKVPLAHGSGAIMDWEARSPTGEVVLARAYIAIVKQSGVSLIAMGQRDKVMAREPVLRKIFTSFSVDEGERDPAVVGTWSLVSTYSLSNSSPFESASSAARSVSETQKTLVINADGTWHETVVSQFIAMGASNPITGGPIILDSGPEKKTYNGRWNAGNGVLYLMSQDDRYSDYKYQVRRGTKGRELVLAADGKGEVWAE